MKINLPPWATLATLVAAFVAPPLHADPPALNYYPSEIVTLPTVTGQNFGPQPVAVAMNDQGYVLVQDTNSGDQRGPMVYFNHKLYPVNLGSLTSVGIVYMSNTAADGSFWLAGTCVNSADGTTHAVRWQIFADGTSSAPDMTHNRVLPPDSQNPGEQSEAHPTAINNAGQMVGYGQSYLVDVPMQWLPGDDTSYSAGTTGEVTWIDDSGNLLDLGGEAGNPPTPMYAGQTLSIPTVNDYWQLSSITGTKVVGQRDITDTGSGSQVAFVYDVTTGVTTDLPHVASRNGGAPFYDDIALRINANGDVIGRGGSDYMNVLWKYDATTRTYTSYREDSDFGAALNGTNLYSDGGGSDYSLTGIAKDGTLAMSYARLSNATAQDGYVLVLLKPGPDPRPVITPTDPTVPNAVTIYTEPGQAFSYQFTATNSPTDFQLLDPTTGGSYALPTGVSFDAATGVLSGTGPATGDYYFTAEATNGQGYGAFGASVTLASGDLPVVADQSATAHLNQAFTYKVVATGATAFYPGGSLPAGVGFDTTTGILSGTPTQAGTFPLTINATNDIGQTRATLTLTVDNKPPAAFTVSLAKPADQQNVVAGTAIKAKAKVDLTNAGTETVASLVFQLDGAPVGAALTAKPYKATIPLDGSLNGTHSLTVVATANDGRTAVSAPLTINVAARFVDLAAASTLKPKFGTDGKITIKGQYSVSNLGNTASVPCYVRFYLSNDAVFDSSDVSLDALATPILGKDPGFDFAIPGLPPNTTLNSTDPGTVLPKLKLALPSTLLPLLTQYSGKYLLGVVDPENTEGEEASTRANNVIAYQLP